MKSTKTPLRHFNETVRKFIGDLKGAFEKNDREIIMIETAFELTSVNARLFIKPFQTNLLGNDTFIQHIMQDDVNFFILFDFSSIIDKGDDTCIRMFNKFKQAAIENRQNKVLLNAIFNWLKVMIYYARLDQGIDIRSKQTTPTQQSESSYVQQNEGDAAGI